MKKLLYLFAIILITFISCNKEEEDCGCVKTTRESGWVNNNNFNRRYNIIKSVENVPCQNTNIPYVFVSGNRDTSDNLVSYSICCDNINDPNNDCN
jgi:hypothetical protein